jgi:hypothetical protein
MPWLVTLAFATQENPGHLQPATLAHSFTSLALEGWVSSTTQQD